MLRTEGFAVEAVGEQGVGVERPLQGKGSGEAVRAVKEDLDRTGLDPCAIQKVRQRDPLPRSGADGAQPPLLARDAWAHEGAPVAGAFEGRAQAATGQPPELLRREPERTPHRPADRQRRHSRGDGKVVAHVEALDRRPYLVLQADRTFGAERIAAHHHEL